MATFSPPYGMGTDFGLIYKNVDRWTTPLIKTPL